MGRYRRNCNWTARISGREANGHEREIFEKSRETQGEGPRLRLERSNFLGIGGGTRSGYFEKEKRGREKEVGCSRGSRC